jgi:transposase InsO family protein
VGVGWISKLLDLGMGGRGLDFLPLAALIKNIRSDNGTEFKNSQIEGFLEDEGIKHEFSSPYTPQQNGVVERKNRTLLDMARTMLDEYKTPDRFWAEAINTACYSINWLYLH